MEQRPTKKQRELLSFIDGFIKGNGYGPSYREIMRALDYKSVSTVATHIDGLIIKGWLIKKDNSARTLEVVTHSLDTTMPKTATPKTAEQEIRTRLEQLRGTDNEAHAREVEVLTEALAILGYDAAHDTRVA